MEDSQSQAHESTNGGRRTLQKEEKKYAKWIGRALQLRKLVKKLSAGELRNDPDGAALLQALFSNEEIKTDTWQDLPPKKIDAKTALDSEFLEKNSR